MRSMETVPEAITTAPEAGAIASSTRRRRCGPRTVGVPAGTSPLPFTASPYGDARLTLMARSRLFGLSRLDLTRLIRPAEQVVERAVLEHHHDHVVQAILTRRSGHRRPQLIAAPTRSPLRPDSTTRARVRHRPVWMIRAPRSIRMTRAAIGACRIAGHMGEPANQTAAVADAPART